MISGIISSYLPPVSKYMDTVHIAQWTQWTYCVAESYCSLLTHPNIKIWKVREPQTDNQLPQSPFAGLF